MSSMDTGFLRERSVQVFCNARAIKSNPLASMGDLCEELLRLDPRDHLVHYTESTECFSVTQLVSSVQ